MTMDTVMSRRRFLVGARAEEHCPIAPPGATPLGLASCSGCGACAEHCPTGIIRLVDRRPSLDFSAGECLFCGKCADACPEPVFTGERHFAHVAAIGSHCLAQNAVSCQSCGDVCPTAAIRFRPRLGGPFTPDLDASACNGCGACIAICPVSAIDIRQPSLEVAHA
ncbi:ferredoxin-type protein NapF [Agrobacterium sp. a22-2]|nr:ferredoxin-type protein NapF [Agrobacterium sp. a22-2]